MAFAILALAMSIDSASREYNCDTIEVNAVYDLHGKKLFTQIIFWEWTDEGERVLYWKFLGRDDTTIRLGRSTFFLAAGSVCRFRSRYFRRSWTQHDPEVADREFRPCCDRLEIK